MRVKSIVISRLSRLFTFTVFFSLFLSFVQPVFADNYADIVFDIRSDGSVDLQGTTNHPLLQSQVTQDFTFKKGEYWLLNVTENELFSEFAYKVLLPQGSVINYVKSSGTFRIGTENDRAYVSGVGINSSMIILIQYSLSSTKTPSSFSIENLNPLILVGFGLIITLAVIGYLLLSKNKTSKSSVTSKSQESYSESNSIVQDSNSGAWYDKGFLTDRQKMIVEVLEKNDKGKKHITQKYLEDTLKIPKSSLSRNIDSLVRKGIIKKESKGMTNVLVINPKKPEN